MNPYLMPYPKINSKMDQILTQRGGKEESQSKCPEYNFQIAFFIKRNQIYIKKWLISGFKEKKQTNKNKTHNNIQRWAWNIFSYLLSKTLANLLRPNQKDTKLQLAKELAVQIRDSTSHSRDKDCGIFI